MQIEIGDARTLCRRILQLTHLPVESAEVLTDHLIDAHLTGHTYAGLPRLLVLLDRIRETARDDLGRHKIVSETDSTVWIDGCGNLGYITSQRATEIGIRKAAAANVAVVGAFNSHFSGRLGYYAEQAARAGLVALQVNNAAPVMAPAGGKYPVLGTNPFCLAIPNSQGPILCDFTPAATTLGALDLAAHSGQSVPAGQAVDAQGQPTTDPFAALGGAILPWGGHKGFVLSLAVAALGVLAGGDSIPEKFGSWGYLFIFMRPDLFLPAGEFESRMDELAESIRNCTEDGRLPGERSRALRNESLKRGSIDLPDDVYKALIGLVS